MKKFNANFSRAYPVLTSFFFLLLIHSMHLSAIDSYIELKNPNIIYDMAESLFFMADDEGTLTFDQIRHSEDFLPIRNGRRSFGLTDSVFWAKITVKNNVPGRDFWILELNYPMMQNYQIFLMEPDESFTKIESGSVIPFKSRPYIYRNYIHLISLPYGIPRTIFFKFSTAGTMRFPLSLKTGEIFSRMSGRDYTVYGMYFCFMLMAGLIGIIFFHLQKDRAYLYFGISSFCYFFFESIQTGFHIDVISLYRFSNVLNLYIFFGGSALGFLTLLSSSFLVVSHHFRHGWYGSYCLSFIRFFVFLCFAAAVLGLFLPAGVMLPIFAGMGIIMVLINISLSILFLTRGYRPARLFFLSFMLLLLSVALFALRGWGILPTTIITLYTKEIGFFLMVITLMAGMLFRMREINRKAEEVQTLKLERKTQHTQKLESLGLLAGGIAHDFNNFLMAILGNIDLALLDLPKYSDAKTVLEEAKRTAHKAASLTNQMLAYSGKGFSRIETLHLDDVISEMTVLLTSSIGKHITMDISTGKKLSPVSADRSQIQQVIMNLVINASESIESAEGTIHITTDEMYCTEEMLKQNRITSEPAPGKYIFLKISDTGTGMDNSTREKIFDPFFTTKFTGRGLGMSMVLGIVKAHNGAVFLETAESKGSVFTILFPAST